MNKILPILLAAVLVGCQSMPPGRTTFTPANPAKMKPIASHNTPAWREAKHFQHGVNLGNYLEVPPGQHWSVTFSGYEMAMIKREGFDHLRVPVGWQHYAGPAPDFTLSLLVFSNVDSIVNQALANKLSVMINIHHFDELDKDPQGTTAEFLKIWDQIAVHYQRYPDQLAFELDNEPHGHATTALMNPIYAQAIAEIRKTNPHRTIFVEPGNWGNIEELKNLVLLPDDNVIVSIHCYDPFYFTHQGATWTGGETPLTGIVFPGPPATPLVINTNLPVKPWLRSWIEKYNTLPTDKNPSSPLAFTKKLEYCRAWSDFYGRPVHLGEFGAFTKADEASRANFYSAMRRTAEQEKIGWCLWDWNDGFRYWDQQAQQAMPGMHAALFDK